MRYCVRPFLHPNPQALVLPFVTSLHLHTMFFKASLVIAAAAAAVSASPIAPRDATIVLPVKSHVNVASMSNIVAKGQKVISKVNGGSSVGNVDASGPATNDDVSYVAAVTIGSKVESLIVDTGCMLLV